MKLKALFIKSAPVLFLFLVSGFCILPFFLGRAFPYAGDFSGSDLSELNLPLRYAASQSWLSGQIPLWHQGLDNGFPLVAEGQAGVFYPLNLIYLILPFVTAVNLGFFLNFFLASFFLYLYAKSLKLSTPAALFSALAFAFSGFFVFRLKHLNMINAAIWLPLIFFLVEKYFAASKKSGWLALLGLVFAVQFFAGHPQISYISVLSAFFYFVLRFVFQSPGLKKITLKDWLLRVLLPWMILGFLSLGLSAVQFLPTLELSFFSERSTRLDFEMATINIFPPRQLLTLFNPYLYGNPAQNQTDTKYHHTDVFWENNCYLGLLTVIFAFLALVCLTRSEKQIRFFGILLLIFLFFILGRYNLLYIFAWLFIPGLKVFRFSQRFLLPFILIACVLGGFGFDLFLKLLKIIFTEKIRIKKPGLVILTAAAVFLAVLLLDIFAYARQYVAMMPADYFKPDKTVAWLKQDPETFRYLAVDWQDSWFSANEKAGGWGKSQEDYYFHRQLIQPNLNLFFGLATADDRAGKEGGQLYKPFSELSWCLKKMEFLDNENNKIVLSEPYLKVNGMQNVKYLLSYYELVNENLELKGSFLDKDLPDLRIYENKYFLPRAFLAFDYRLEADPAKFLKKIEDDFFDYSRQLILEQAPVKWQKPAEPGPIQAVRIEAWENQQIRLRSSAKTQGLLFLSLIDYPGWQAFVDGRPAEILKANYAFSAVVLSPGEHEVLFIFRPVSFYAGLAISSASAFLIILFFIGPYLLKRKKSGYAE